MAQRTEPKESFDNFPTPPWATRALIEHVVGKHTDLRNQTCLEPACGQGYMSLALKEYFGSVSSSDVADYHYGKISDFTSENYEENSYDWVITNPPFKLAEEFILKSLPIARKGVAILARTVFLESIGRFHRVFTPYPPAIFAQFSERVPMVKGRLDQKASTATGYAWFVWLKQQEEGPKLTWIPPCRKSLELQHDYDDGTDYRTTSTLEPRLPYLER